MPQAPRCRTGGVRPGIPGCAPKPLVAGHSGLNVQRERPWGQCMGILSGTYGVTASDQEEDPVKNGPPRLTGRGFVWFETCQEGRGDKQQVSGPGRDRTKPVCWLPYAGDPHLLRPQSSDFSGLPCSPLLPGGCLSTACLCFSAVTEMGLGEVRVALLVLLVWSTRQLKILHLTLPAWLPALSGRCPEPPAGPAHLQPLRQLREVALHPSWRSARGPGARPHGPSRRRIIAAWACQAEAQQGPLSCAERALCCQLLRTHIRAQGAHRHWSLGLGL